MNDKGMIALYLASSLVNLLKHEYKSQCKLIKDPNSIRMNNFLINTSVPITLCGRMLTFRDTNRSFTVGGDF